MAHFAELDEHNVVKRVIVVNNRNIMNPQGIEDENIGIEFCQSILGNEIFKQTSYNATFRKNFAGIGYTYDHVLNAFIPPKPFTSWQLNEDTCQWESPIPCPNQTGKIYRWNEQTVSWEEFDLP